MSEREFIEAYTEAALWASTDEDGVPLDENFDESDIHWETLEKMEDDASDFYAANESMLTVDGNSDGDGGHNFWLTRNGHGAGFWDGDYPTYEDELTDAAKAYGGYDLYGGDDGIIYGS